MIRAGRFLANFAPNRPVPSEEISFGGTQATLYRGTRRSGAPGWVVLHGISVSGRAHPALVRFARALAASGALVLVPEIPEWRELRIAPQQAQAVIGESATYLASRADVQPGGVGLAGFSFGATQALNAAADPSLHDVLRAVVGFGGYCDLRRTLICMLTGEHEWAGTRHQLNPDPYGRWVVAGNYLTRIPEYAAMGAVAESLRALAREAGRLGVFAGDPILNVVNTRLRTRLNASEQPVWDLLAPLAGDSRVNAAAAEAFANRLAAAGVGAEPLLDPQPCLPRIHCRVVLAHGREDRLIPFTETLRLHAMLPPETHASSTITGLFEHSGGRSPVRWAAYAREVARFGRLLYRALGTV
jgi:pimeloyl-ACP methyl ester carboxylesterase